MTNRLNLLIILNLLVFNLGLLTLAYKDTSKPAIIRLPSSVDQPVPPKPELPPNYKLTIPIPAHLGYGEMVKQLEGWQKEAPELSEMGSYGKSSSGNDLVYFRIHNRKNSNKPVVLITAAIHGNESWSTGVIMGYIGTMLDQYGDDEQITEIINNTDLYFIPIVCPDSYPDRRETDGVDPNRNFPTPKNPDKTSVQPVQLLREFFLSLRPTAVISGHTWGRLYLQPHGDTLRDPPNHADYQRIVGKMASMSQYTLEKAYQVYRHPITGTEVDWFYRRGAFSTLPNGKKIHRGAFSIVVEFGTHQRPPTCDEITSEFNRTFQAFLYFIKEAPKVEIWWDEQGNPVNADGTPKISGWKAAA